MKVYQRYLAREIYSAVTLVLVAFLMLFAFFDFINELQSLGKGSYQLRYMAYFVLLTLPGHIYELAPIAVLIGTLYALTMLARHSEITVLRASGLSTSAILSSLAKVGLAFILLTFIVGDFIAPPAERAAKQLRLEAMSRVVGQEFRSGLWVKDDMSFINVRTVLPDSRLEDVRMDVTWDAVWGEDYPVLQAVFMLETVAVLTANYIADLMLFRLDPRVKI